MIDIRRAKTHDEQFNEWMERFEDPKQIAAQGQLPYIQPARKVETERLIFPVARGTKRFLKTITGYRSQDDLNSAIRDGLRKQFNEENTDKAILQAFTIRQSRQPDANRPELYELYETGEIDQALEMIGKRWVIGRPKLKR